MPDGFGTGSFVVLALLNSVDQILVFVPLVSTGMVTALELEAAPAATCCNSWSCGTCSG